MNTKRDESLDREKATRGYVSRTLAGPPTPPRRSPSEALAQPHPKPSVEADLPPGTEIVGRYRLEETVGRGGMASVYRGRHVDIGNTVAIKVMRSDVASVDGAAGRFLTEARAVAAVQHPGVVRVTDFGQLECGRTFMVMEHLVGRDLDTLVCDRGPLPWNELEPILTQACDALQAAHEAGIVHRDVKPANIFVLHDALEGRNVKVLDFGIAKVTDEMARGTNGPHTQTSGMLIGTPDYMAPEQGRYAEVDLRADIYALGVTAFTCLTGEPPFPDAAHPVEQIAKHMYETPPTLAEAGASVPEGVQALISRAMAKDPEARFQTMEEFRCAIEALRSGTREDGAVTLGDSGTDAPSTPSAEQDLAFVAQQPEPARRFRSVAAVAALVVAGVGFVMTGGSTSLLPGSDIALAAVTPSAPTDVHADTTEVEPFPTPQLPALAKDETIDAEPIQEASERVDSLTVGTPGVTTSALEIGAVLQGETPPTEPQTEEPASEPEPEPKPKRARKRGRHARPDPAPAPSETVFEHVEPPEPAPRAPDPVDPLPAPERPTQEVGAIKNPYD